MPEVGTGPEGVVPLEPSSLLAVLDDVGDVAFRLDSSGRFLHLAPAWQSLTGHAPGASLGLSLFDFIAPESRAECEAAFRALAVDGARTSRHEVRCVTQSGVTFPARIAWRLDAGGEAGATGVLRALDVDSEAIGVARDDYARSVALRALLKIALESANLDDFLRRALAPILGLPGLGVRPQGGIFLLQGSPPELRLRASQSLSLQVLRECAAVPLGRCLCGRVAVSGQMLTTRSVDERHENCEGCEPHGHYVAPIRSAGRLLGVLVLYTDAGKPRDERLEDFIEVVADTLATAIERHGSRAEFQALIEQSSDAVTVHRHGRFVFVNPAAIRYLGCSVAEDLLGQRVTDFLHPDEQTTSRALVRRVWDTGQPSSPHEVRLRRRDGSDLVAEVVELRVGFGGEPAILALARDVTERRHLAARVMQMDRMIAVGTMATGVAHEINNPLAYVLANVCYVSDRVDALLGGKAQDGRDGAPTALDPPSLRELSAALTEARMGAERVRDIVRDLSTLARTDAGDSGTVDSLRSVLAAAISIARSEIDHRARLVESYDELPPVVGSETRLGQVFLNLLVNAAHAIPEGRPGKGEIRVTARQDGDLVRVEIGDDGGGIDPAFHERIFDPFFTTKPIGQGTGLGLSICRGIVTGLGGEITVTSELGKGSSFVVTLPRASYATGLGAPSTLPSPASVRVLVVDDDQPVASALRRLLEREHQTTEVHSAREALFLLAAGARFDAIFCDLMMPGMSGMELYDALRAGQPEIAKRVVFMTGGAFTAGAQEFLAAIPNPRIAKPFDVTALRLALAQVLEANRA